MIFKGWNSAPAGEVVDASLGFIYQAEVPLFSKPGKREQREVTESESKLERLVPRLNERVRRLERGGQMLRLR